MKKIAFHTFITDDNIVNLGAIKMIQSFKHFHPDIPLYIFNTKDWVEQCVKNQVPMKFSSPLMCKLLENEYETIVHIDSDIIVVDRLNEILECDYDVAVVRNNSDLGTAGCGNGLSANGMIPVDEYFNCGLYAIKNKNLLNIWIDMNKKYGEQFTHFEQDIFNIMLRQQNNLKIKFLDHKNSNVYYANSNSYGVSRHNESWQDVILKDGKFYLNNKLIKTFHDAGGGPYRLDIDQLFSKDVGKELKKICCVL